METKKKITAMSAEEIEGAKKSLYTKKTWTTVKEYTLEQYAEYVEPALKHIAGNPTIIAVKKKNRGYFLKMEFPLEGNDTSECELSFQKEESRFDEDDVIDLATVKFYKEESLGKVHFYAKGDVLDE